MFYKIGTSPQSMAYGTNLSLGAVKLSHVWNIVTTYSMYLNALRTLIEVEVIQSGPLHLRNSQLRLAFRFSLVSSGFSSSKYSLIYINKTQALKKA